MKYHEPERGKRREHKTEKRENYMNCRSQKWQNPGLLDSPLLIASWVSLNLHLRATDTKKLNTSGKCELSKSTVLKVQKLLLFRV